MRVLVAVTGASGVAYALRLIEVLKSSHMLEAVIYTGAALKVAEAEEDIDLESWLKSLGVASYRDEEIDAPYASSSRAPHAMVIVPCSMKTLAAISHGYADGLVARAALAMLRLRRPLVLVVRETPLGVAELKNMLEAALAGAVVLPASPGFYHKPRTVKDMVDFIVGKILDVLGVEHSLYKRWRS